MGEEDEDEEAAGVALAGTIAAARRVLKGCSRGKCVAGWHAGLRTWARGALHPKARGAGQSWGNRQHLRGLFV